MNRLLIFVLLIISTFSFGCSYSQTTKDAWKYSKRQYYSYINTPAELDLEETGSSADYQLALSQHAMDVDQKLAKFIRRMDNSDMSPDSKWVQDMMSDFPWLSGVALVEENGTVMSQFPATPAKPFDISPLLVEDEKQRMLALRSYVQQTAMGPEVYVAKPVYRDGNFRGLVVSHFDACTLLESGSGDPNKIAVYCPQGEIWVGNAMVGSLAGVNWEEELLRRSSGHVGNVYWTTRYVGNTPVVYAISTSSTPIEDHGTADNKMQSSRDDALTPTEVTSY